MSSAALAFVFNPDCRKLVSLDPSTTVIRVYDVPSLRLSLTLDGSGEPSEATRSSIRTIPYLFTINHASELLQVSPFGRVTRRLDDNFLRSSSERLVARISSSTSSLVRETSDILTILSGSAVECKRALRHRVSHVCLWLSKQWEECDAVDKALTACARLLHSIDEIRSGDVTDLMTGVSFLLALPLHAPPRLSVYVCTAGDGLITPFARVQWGVDPAKTVVSGPGARVAHAGHTETAKRMNVVSIEPRDGDGETVHGLSVADVHVEVVVNGTSLPATAVSVSQSSETSFQVNYTVPTDSCGRKVALYVSLCQSPLTRLDVEVSHDCLLATELRLIICCVIAGTGHHLRDIRSQLHCW